MNVELAKEVLQHLEDRPETHYQGTYEEEWADGERGKFPNFCGTTRCVAGWALYFSDPTSRIEETARRVTGRDYVDYFEGGRIVLGLKLEEADELFSGATGEGEAVEMLRDLIDEYTAE